MCSLDEFLCRLGMLFFILFIGRAIYLCINEILSFLVL